MPNEPDQTRTTECDNGERQPDANQPAGGTPEHRDDGHRMEKHNRPITARPDATNG